VQEFVTRVAIKMHSFFWTGGHIHGEPMVSTTWGRSETSILGLLSATDLQLSPSERTDPFTLQILTSLLTSPAPHVSCSSHLLLLTTIKAIPTSPKKHPLFLTSHPSTPLITATPCTSLSSFVTLCGKGFGHHDTFDSIDQRVAANLRPQVE
jgi:hypothetical protein